MSDPREAALELLRSATLASFELVDVEVGDLAPEGSMSAVLQVHEDDLDWSAHALMFAICALSFEDARPAGGSALEYAGDDDELTVGDFATHLRFERGQLAIHLDYLRGRMVKTTMSVSAEGRVEIATVNRGQSLARWLDRLQGRGHVTLLASTAPAEA